MVRLFLSSPDTLSPPMSPGCTLFLSIWVSHDFLEDLGSSLELFSRTQLPPLKNGWGQLRYKGRKLVLPQTPTLLPDLFLSP